MGYGSNSLQVTHTGKFRDLSQSVQNLQAALLLDLEAALIVLCFPKQSKNKLSETNNIATIGLSVNLHQLGAIDIVGSQNYWL